MASAAARSTAGATCVYRSDVIARELCPSRWLTTFIGTPAASARLALVCRRSCKGPPPTCPGRGTHCLGDRMVRHRPRLHPRGRDCAASGLCLAPLPQTGATIGTSANPACLKRRISDAVYRQLVADAHRARLTTSPKEIGAGPGGHCGASQESSAVDLPPHIDTSDQPLPGPANPTLQPSRTVRKSPSRKTPQTTG